MRGILALIIGVLFIGLGLGQLPMDDQPPIFLRAIIGLFGLIMLWGGLYHLRLRVWRWLAYRGGREKRGTIHLFQPVGDDDNIAELVFATSTAQWRISADASRGLKQVYQSEHPVKATAYFGEDDLIYAINIGEKRIMPLSPGRPVSPLPATA